MSVRVGESGVLEEYYDVAGAARYRHGRRAYLQRTYDAAVLVHDLCDSSTRSALSRIWVPEVMARLGDVNAVEAGGRFDDDALHVRSKGVLNELRLLWRHARSAYSGVSHAQACREAVRLLIRFGRLLLHELDIWPDERIDSEAERELLASSTVPIAIVGMKADLIRRTHHDGDRYRHPEKNVTAIATHRGVVAHDPQLLAFLHRAADIAKRKSNAPSHRRIPVATHTRHLSLSF